MRAKNETSITNYTITRSSRKTLAIYIKPDDRSPDGSAVEVRAPLKLAKSEIERFVASKSRWIAKKQAQIAENRLAEPREILSSQYTPGEFEKSARELVKMWEQRFGVTASFVGFRAMTSRWGSCTAKTRRLRINAALAYCPRECLEYIIVHELAHLRENNHSQRFWKIVADALPDYKARKMKLKALSWIFYS